MLVHTFGQGHLRQKNRGFCFSVLLLISAVTVNGQFWTTVAFFHITEQLLLHMCQDTIYDFLIFLLYIFSLLHIPCSCWTLCCTFSMVPVQRAFCFYAVPTSSGALSYDPGNTLWKFLKSCMQLAVVPATKGRPWDQYKLSGDLSWQVYFGQGNNQMYNRRCPLFGGVFSLKGPYMVGTL